MDIWPTTVEHRNIRSPSSTLEESRSAHFSNGKRFVTDLLPKFRIKCFHSGSLNTEVKIEFLFL